MIQQLINLMGQPINNPKTKAFFDEYGFKYPAKDTQSVKAGSQTFYLNHRKLGVNLVFQTKAWHPQYPPVPSEKTAMFHYRLSEVQFLKEKVKDMMLQYLGIKQNSSLEELKTKFGNPKKFEDGELNPRFFWQIEIDKQKDIVVNLNFQKGSVHSVWMVIPDSGFFDELPTPELLNAIGKPINIPEVKAFIQKYAGIYPTKDTICTTIDPADGKTYYAREKIAEQYFDLLIHGLPLGLLDFGLKDTGIFNSVAAKKKDHYYPVLRTISFINEASRSLVKYPKGVTSADTLDTLREKLGKPDEETEAYCTWNMLLENDSIIMPVTYNKKDEYSDEHISEQISISINPNKK